MYTTMETNIQEWIKSEIVRPWQQSPPQNQEKTALQSCTVLHATANNVASLVTCVVKCVNFLVACVVAYFWNFVYGQISFRQTNSVQFQRVQTNVFNFPLVRALWTFQIWHFWPNNNLYSFFFPTLIRATLVHDLTYFC